MDRSVKPPIVQDEAGNRGVGNEPLGEMIHLSTATCRSFRQARSFRHSIISPAVYSPGYPTKGRIDPSTYTFTDALRDIQHIRSVSVREIKLPMRFSEGKILNSKWDEAEKYISNPLSGEVPIQCLSSSTASKTWAECTHTVPPVSKISKSAPLSCPYHAAEELHPITMIPPIEAVAYSEVGELKGRNGSWMRDVGTQITTLDYNSSSPSLTSAPIDEKRSDSFRFVGKNCCIFHRKPKSGELVDKELRESREKNTENSNRNEKNREMKWVKTFFSWKMWWAAKQERRKKREKICRERPSNEKAEKNFTIITLQAPLLE